MNSVKAARVFTAIALALLVLPLARAAGDTSPLRDIVGSSTGGHWPRPGNLPSRPYCSGDPPELLNSDTVTREYQLTCGRKTERASISPSEKRVLKGKAGCTIQLLDGDSLGTAETLYSEMLCTIESGNLMCDLL